MHTEPFDNQICICTYFYIHIVVLEVFMYISITWMQWLHWFDVTTRPFVTLLASLLLSWSSLLANYVHLTLIIIFIGVLHPVPSTYISIDISMYLNVCTQVILFVTFNVCYCYTHLSFFLLLLDDDVTTGTLFRSPQSPQPLRLPARTDIKIEREHPGVIYPRPRHPQQTLRISESIHSRLCKL